MTAASAAAAVQPVLRHAPLQQSPAIHHLWLLDTDASMHITLKADIMTQPMMGSRHAHSVPGDVRMPAACMVCARGVPHPLVCTVSILIHVLCMAGLAPLPVVLSCHEARCWLCRTVLLLLLLAALLLLLLPLISTTDMFLS